MSEDQTQSYFTYQKNSQSYQLAYNIFGDMAGFPIFINYGLIGSIQLPNDFINKAKNANIKLIILQRSGYGSSDFIDMQSYKDWADITKQFLDYINIYNFGVIGISAGSPYAYAMVNQFAERLTGGVYILSGLPYILDKKIFNLYKEENKLFYQKIWHYTQAQIQQEMAQLLNSNHSLVGIAQSVWLQMQDWGFDVYQLAPTINYWHSKDDEEIAYSAVKTMVDNMANATLHIQAQKGHFPSEQTFSKVFAMVNDRVKNKTTYQ